MHPELLELQKARIVYPQETGLASLIGELNPTPFFNAFGKRVQLNSVINSRPLLGLHINKLKCLLDRLQLILAEEPALCLLSTLSSVGVKRMVKLNNGCLERLVVVHYVDEIGSGSIVV